MHVFPPRQVGGADNGGQLARGLDVPGTDKLPDYVHAVQKLPDTDHVRRGGRKYPLEVENEDGVLSWA